MKKNKAMLYFVYILKSLINESTYVGVTSQEVGLRLQEHNCGGNKWTKKYKPYKLVYYENFYCKKDAIHRENFLKSGIGNKLVNLIVNNF